MSADICLLNFIHISDLHFSDRLDPNANSTVPRFIARHDIFEGFLGHHTCALSALQRFYADERLADPACGLIVSGDLTANGAPQQFSMAATFLDSHLGRPDWQNWTITGNHDQWPGSNWVIGASSPARAQNFSAGFPQLPAPFPLQHGTSVRFIFIDTDADVRPYSFNRVNARGAFVSQLTAVQKQLPPRKPREIRVLVLHHSMMPSHPTAGKAPKSLNRKTEITPGSLRALEAFLVDHQIQVLLCGHLHIPRLSHVQVSNGKQQLNVLEARCGTTTQRDEWSYQMLAKLAALGNKPRPLSPNTLLQHRLLQRNGSLVWRSEIFWRNSSSKFVNLSATVSPLMPKMMSTEFTLQP